jgi:hypothetical protein
MFAGFKRALEVTPYGTAANRSDDGTGELLFVIVCGGVPVRLGELK